MRESARRSVLTEAGISDLAASSGKGMEFLRLKGFENAVIMAANRALEEWREEAHKGARRRGHAGDAAAGWLAGR